MTSPQLGLGRLWDWVTLKKQHVYHFNQGSIDDKELLGNKGANLCEMFRMGLPVPHGFIISSEACKEFLLQNDKSNLDEHVIIEIERSVRELERQTGKSFGMNPSVDPHDSKSFQMPLLLSVRSGASVSMPGMMDTILNLGINESLVHIMARASNNIRWTYDTYRRFLQMFGTVVLNIDNSNYEKILEDARMKRGVDHDSLLTDSDLIHVVNQFKVFTQVPDDPWEQLRMAVKSVFLSWNSARAIKYRDIHNIPQNLGTAVVIQTMVFGNLNIRSGSGVAFTRNPATGEPSICGEYLPNSEGEDVVAGLRTPVKLIDLGNDQPSVYDALNHIGKLLEKHYRDMQDIEFTVENGILYILQTRSGKRTASAAVKIAVDMVQERMITEREALMRIDAKSMDYFLHPMVDPSAVGKLNNVCIGKGLAASAGAAMGEIVFTNEEAEFCADKGRKCILCRRETSADDIGGLSVAEGVLTTFGGLTSHAAVVMRSMGKSAVTGARDLVVDASCKKVKFKDGTVVLSKGDVITIDGSTGYVYKGSIPLVTSGHSPDFQTMLQWADKYKDMHVFANADTPDEAAKAIELGADGVGLCRTEHMFFQQERLILFRQLLLSDAGDVRKECLDKLCVMQQEDFEKIFSIMNGKQVIMRLIDPPTHEFLPDPASSVFSTEVEHIANTIGCDIDQCKQKIFELQERNPMLGCRGCRLGLVHPEIVAMQVKAMTRSIFASKKQGIELFPQILIPLVFSDHEVDRLITIMENEISDCCQKEERNPFEINLQFGAMIETPRSCIRADKIASNSLVGFISFGTNDLTQLVFGMSRDDTQQYLPFYIRNHLVARDPFLSLDTHGVGPLIHMAIKRARGVNSTIKVGVCGEHAADPLSIRFFYHEGVESLSCSPYKIPIAKIAAAQARIEYLTRQQAKEQDRFHQLLEAEFQLF